ncbi:MAG: DUF167 domain-containing protein [Ignavibacteria bacterium]
MRIKVRVKANASVNEIRKLGNDYYEVRVTSAPEKGRANEKVRELLAKYFKSPKSKINLIIGKTHKEKVFEIEQG